MKVAEKWGIDVIEKYGIDVSCVKKDYYWELRKIK